MIRTWECLPASLSAISRPTSTAMKHYLANQPWTTSLTTTHTKCCISFIWLISIVEVTCCLRLARLCVVDSCLMFHRQARVMTTIASCFSVSFLLKTLRYHPGAVIRPVACDHVEMFFGCHEGLWFTELFLHQINECTGDFMSGQAKFLELCAY